ncbi:hypothetical protein NC653_025765 [Populus alba x Populus x berolinensis]|uniref:Uncharacterized protein n=1 Tax=Populus alba x Populus x berolinensis TaxID=444605 RepID=A0AAD6MC22_9ROSI|nr:hypothetical protein NC653_025765 [Populus alba x Populus x berolinensis]
MEWKHDWCAICGAAGAAVLAGVEKWDKPPVGFLKWNTDAAILDQGAAMGAGFVIRNNEGAGLSNFLIELDAKIS